MNITWKFVCVAALALSISAIVMIERSRVLPPDQVRREVEKQLAARERTLVDRCRPTINQMRADVGQPKKEINTMEDAVDALVSIFNIGADSAARSDARPK